MFYFDKKSEIHTYFSGVAYGKKTVVLSLKGLEEFVLKNHKIKDLSGGRYSLVFCDHKDDSVIVQTDPTGQDCIFLYENEGFWAISNSLYKLTKELKKREEKLEVYLPSLTAYKIKHTLGNQPISNNSIIANIKIIPRDCFLEIKNSIVSVKNRPMYGDEIHNNQGYINNLNETLRDIVNVLNAINTRIPEGNVKCDLTGGYDSRAVFAIANKSKIVDGLLIESNKENIDDYFVASYIANYFGMTLSEVNLPKVAKISKDFLKYELYKYGNAGVYTKIYKAQYSIVPNALHLHGAGGESLRGQYINSPLKINKNLKQYFDNDEESYSLVSKEFLSYFKENKLDINDEKSMLNHSRSFRARFHFGRNWYRSLSMPIFSPLCDIRLEKLSDYLINAKGFLKNPIFYHIYLMMDNNIAFFPFDDSKKNLDLNKLQEYKEISQCLNMASELLIEENYNIYGCFGDCKYDYDQVLIDEILTEEVPQDLKFEDYILYEKNIFLKNSPSELKWVANNPSIVPILNIIFSK